MYMYWKGTVPSLYLWTMVSMSFIFGLRKRGGITGIRKHSVESMGISWDEITEKRHLLLESLKNDMEKVFDHELCEEKEFRYSVLEGLL